MKIKGAYNLQKAKVEGDNAVAKMKNESNKEIPAVAKKLVHVKEDKTAVKEELGNEQAKTLQLVELVLDEERHSEQLIRDLKNARAVATCQVCSQQFDGSEMRQAELDPCRHSMCLSCVNSHHVSRCCLVPNCNKSITYSKQYW